MRAIDRPAVRWLLGALDVVALGCAAGLVFAQLEFDLFDRLAYAPMALALVAPALGMLTVARPRRGLALASAVANAPMLLVATLLVEAMRDDAGAFAGLLVLVVVVAPLANLWLAVASLRTVTRRHARARTVAHATPPGEPP
jgi:hypothetical protein